MQVLLELKQGKLLILMSELRAAVSVYITKVEMNQYQSMSVISTLKV